MKDTIKLHEICGYLPYGVELAFIVRDEVRYIDKITGISDIGDYDDIKIKLGYNDSEHIWMFKPILRPLSDLTKEIEHNGERFVPIVKLLQEYCFDTNQMTEQEINEYAESMIEIDMSYMAAQMLMEWHFDIHGLIDRNLALNLNDYEI